MEFDTPPHVSHRRRSPLLAPIRVLRARPQLFLAVTLGVVTGLMLPHALRPVTRALIAWNAAVLCYFVAVTMLVSNATHNTIRRRAGLLHEGRLVMLFLTTAAACASFGAIISELGAVKSAMGAEKIAVIGLTIVTVLNSWLFLHLTFAFHYAHEYYAEDARKPATDMHGGLIFPATQKPQYIDFLYFAYVIGVACQTADVSISSPQLRAAALAHGVVSFFYNTTILALLVNIASQFV